MTRTSSATVVRDQAELQRVEHLVLGRPRPAPQLCKPAGISKAEWKVERKRRLAAGATLDASVEPHVRLRERWGHRSGTPETHEHVSRTRQGALARLHQTGAISQDQLAWAHEIAQVAELIMRDANIRTASLETRIDTSRHGDAFYEALGQVRREIAYTRWRGLLPRAALVIDIVVHDLGVASAAIRHRVHKRLAKRALIEALDLWPTVLGEACKQVDGATLNVMHGRIL